MVDRFFQTFIQYTNSARQFALMSEQKHFGQFRFVSSVLQINDTMYPQLLIPDALSRVPPTVHTQPM